MGKHLWMIPVLAVCLATWLSGCKRSAVIEMPPLDGVIVAYGDSLTSGSGASAGEDYPSVLEQLSGRRVINAGVPGERSAEGLRRLPEVLADHRPDLVILCHGGNDILADADPEQISANLAKMIAMIREAGSEVVLLGVPAKGLILRSPGFYRDLAGEYGIPYEGRIVPRILSNSALKSDYVHPNTRGYERMAEEIWEFIRSAAR